MVLMKNILEFIVVSAISIPLTLLLLILSFLFSMFMPEGFQMFWYPIILGCAIFSLYCFQRGYRISIQQILSSKAKAGLIIFLAPFVYLVTESFLISKNYFEMEIYWIPWLLTAQFVYFFFLKINQTSKPFNETSQNVTYSFWSVISILTIFFIVALAYTFMVVQSWGN
jgi:hypothetical protein